MAIDTLNVKERWSATGADTNGGGITVSKTAPSRDTDIYRVFGIQCSGDAAALVTIESPASTVIYRKRFAAAFNMSETFPNGLEAARGQAVQVVISAGTTNTEANIQGVRTG